MNIQTAQERAPPIEKAVNVERWGKNIH